MKRLRTLSVRRYRSKHTHTLYYYYYTHTICYIILYITMCNQQKIIFCLSSCYCYNLHYYAWRR
jgi:hypothetical protein